MSHIGFMYQGEDPSIWALSFNLAHLFESYNQAKRISPIISLPFSPTLPREVISFSFTLIVIYVLKLESLESRFFTSFLCLSSSLLKLLRSRARKRLSTMKLPTCIVMMMKMTMIMALLSTMNLPTCTMMIRGMKMTIIMALSSQHTHRHFADNVFILDNSTHH